MATVINLPIVAPQTPESWSQEHNVSGKTVSPLLKRTLLPVGPAYLAHVRRSLHNHSFEEHDKHEAERRQRQQSEEADSIGDDLGVGDEEETEELLSLNPKEWKQQDHYAVLGLSHLRYKATQDQIKIAHRKKVLKHHPDKKAGAVGDSNDDSFFKCIQKALEVLTNSERRRQFDSADPYYKELEENDPSEKDAKRAVERDPKEFFKLFAPEFEREAHFSKIEPVPLLGSMDDPKDVVEGFYDFWYNFDSWKSFEYYDKEVNEGSDNRDDKRYTEKKNKSERQRRKKEYVARLRLRVDLALSLDPRIKKFKQEEKAAREEKKRKGKPGQASAAEVEKKRLEAEAEKKRLEEEAEKEKAERATAKKEKERLANEAKKARRAAKKAQEAAAGAA
ncbi:hypothetical protein PNOK_0630800 [Pyrrhoderma noxium]|uniref:J domain-containing protein n=1 Tax=Pyrrhoderma noxium TaxID=2282107 RepID=A0A286UDX0_9AGAM|nr:hypothetical protein PNOK_0630800 [Pyrrhoderma noxium]